MISEIKQPKPKKNPPQRILNCLPSANQSDDWTLTTALTVGEAAPAALPAAVDLRDNAWWKINNQGSTGSCVGWAVADSLMRYQFVKSLRLPKNTLLSIRFVWMASKETDEFNGAPSTFIEGDGTSLKAALDVARKYGCLLDTDLPFKSGVLFQGNESTCYAKAARFKVQSYFNLQAGNTIANWKIWLATRGPILVRLNVDQTWDNATATGGNLDVYAIGTGRGGHAVALVGYTADRFIVRNSWGTPWGDNGFAYASIPYAQMAFTESYGITMF